MRPTRLERDRGNLPELLLSFGQALQADLWTALPGIIEKYTAAEQVCSVRVSLSIPTFDDIGTRTEHEIPLLLDVPVYFPQGGGFTLTFPVAKGDECLVVFASRCIDAWWKNGGVQPLNELRMHDLSDGFAFVGFRSQTSVLSPVPSISSVQIRSNDGNTKVDIASGVIEVRAGSVKIGDGGTFKKLINDTFIDLFNNHTHLYSPGPGSPTPTATPATAANASNATTKTEAE